MLNEPELMVGLDLYLNAYMDLLYDRQMGMAAGPIPWGSIHRWGMFHGINDPDEMAVLVSHIRALEATDIELEEAKNKK